jgi:hypothetical protein
MDIVLKIGYPRVEEFCTAAQRFTQTCFHSCANIVQLQLKIQGFVLSLLSVNETINRNLYTTLNAVLLHDSVATWYFLQNFRLFSMTHTLQEHCEWKPFVHHNILLTRTVHIPIDHASEHSPAIARVKACRVSPTRKPETYFRMLTDTNRSTLHIKS